MKKICLVSLFPILMFLFGYNNAPGIQHKTKPDEIIHLDNISGLRNKKELRLGEIVDSIEYIKLETNRNCLLSKSKCAFGNKYMVFITINPAQVLLFSRQGKFIRSIGKQGKGPGEYMWPISIDLAPNENKIIVIDRINDVAIEYDINGNHLQTIKPKASFAQLTYYLDQSTLIYIQSRPSSDSLNFPCLMSLNLNTKEELPIHYMDFKHVTKRFAGVNYNPTFLRNDAGFIFKSSLGDTLYQVNPDLSIVPRVVFYVGNNTPPAYYIRDEADHYDKVGNIYELANHLLIIGKYKKRFHQVCDMTSRELYTLPKINNCKRLSNYDYGIINDIDGLEPYWPFSPLYIRNNSFVEVHQIIDLKKWVETDCYTKADLISNKYQRILTGLVEQSDINDNPIIRILHLKSD